MLLVVLGGACLAAAGLFAALGFADRLWRLYAAGGVLLVAGGLLLGVRGVWRRHRQESSRSSAGRAGGALILVLAVTAMAAGMVLPAGLHARLALRQARARYELSAIRAAAADAVFSELRKGVGIEPGQPVGSSRHTEAVDPAGIRVEVDLAPAERSTLVARGLVRTGLPEGRFATVHASAANDTRRAQAYAVAHESAGGAVTILAWVEL